MDYNLSDLDDKIEFQFLGNDMVYYPKIQEFAILFKGGFFFKEFHDKTKSSQFQYNGRKKTILKSKLIYFVYNRDYNIFDKKIKIIHLDKNCDNNNIENLKIEYVNSKGYYFNKQSKKWMAYIFENKKLKYIGLFENEEEAREAYLKAKKIYHIIN